MLKYEFIKKKLSDEISILNDHDALPSRNQLIKKYKIGEMTVRRALQELVTEGIIYSIQGKGFFVAPKKQYFNEIFTFLHGINFNITKENTGIYPFLIDELDKELSNAGFDMILSFHKNNSQKEKDVLLRLAQKKPYGLIFNASGLKENIPYYKQVVAGNSNTVFVDGIYPDIKANSVCTEKINAYTQMCQFIKNQNYDKIYYIDIDYWKITKTNLDCLQGYKNVFGDKNITLLTKPYFEIIDDFCNELSKDILKYKKVGFVFINSATANIFYYNLKETFCKLNDIIICCADKPSFSIPKNMHVVWLKQNLSKIAKEAVCIIQENSNEIKEVLVPGEIEYINF